MRRHVRRGAGRGRARAWTWALAALGLACVAAAGVRLAQDAASVAASAEAARSVRVDGRVEPGRIRECADDAVAWLEVGATSIDLPVMRAPLGDDTFYLEHDQTGAPSDVGVPYVEADAIADGPAVMAFGHHVALVGGSFTELFDLWEPRRFAEIAQAPTLWTTPEGGTTGYRPVLAARVESDDALARALAGARGSVPRAELHALLGRTKAKADGAEGLVDGARRVLMLVTCASVVPGQSERTVVVLASTREPGVGAARRAELARSPIADSPCWSSGRDERYQANE